MSCWQRPDLPHTLRHCQHDALVSPLDASRDGIALRVRKQVLDPAVVAAVGRNGRQELSSGVMALIAVALRTSVPADSGGCLCSHQGFLSGHYGSQRSLDKGRT